MILIKQREIYYKNFYNNNFLREFRILSESKNINIPAKQFIKFNNQKEISILLKRLQSKDQGNINFYSEIYPFKDWNELEKNLKQNTIKKTRKKYDFSSDKPVRIYDRLYFDFDFDKNPEIAKLKEKINKTIKINDRSTKQELIKEYYTLLLNEQVALEPFKELKKLHNYLLNKNIVNYPVFSGSKGFHLYIFFKSTLFNPVSFNNIAYAIFKMFKNGLKLRTLDKAVFENPTQRIARIPYFKHPVSELYCYPITITDSYTDIIEYSKKPRISQFDIDEHTVNTGNIELLEYIKENIKLENQKQEKLLVLESKRKKLQKEKDLQLFKNRKKGFKEFEKNCIIIANEFLGTPEATYSNYVTYKCFNHSDKKPSLTVYKERFYCAVCGFKLNYLDFIMKYTGADKDEAIKILLSRI